MMAYIHGYSERETRRLYEQSEILESILHDGTAYPAGAHVLEAGCGVGGQTRLLVKRNPGVRFRCVDISEESLALAKQLKTRPGFEQVTFEQRNICDLGFGDETFDHGFICFVLEHLNDPVAALTEIKRVLKPGGTLTCIEGDHGSCFWHPETIESLAAWEGLITAQRDQGHDPNIGRRLTPLLTEAGFDIQYTRPAWLYADRLTPALRDGMVNHIIVPMVLSAQSWIFEHQLVGEDVFTKGIRDLENVDQIEAGTFFYTWFKSLAAKSPS